MTCGVYEIWIGKYFYQGSSKHIEERMKWHENALKRNNHPNKKMQNVFNKYNSFNWHILIECARGIEKDYEQDFINTNWGLKNYLNLNLSVFNPDRTGSKHTEESKLKMSMSKSGTPAWNKGKTGLGGYKLNYSNVSCPHCGKIGRHSNMIRWHFDNCKNKEVSNSTL